MPNESGQGDSLPRSKDYIANLFVVLSKLPVNQLMLLYGDLFTESEAVMLAKRLEIARGLLDGKSYTQIQRQLGVTANTVAQIQKVLKNAGLGFRAAGTLLASIEESAFVVKKLQDAPESTARPLPAETKSKSFKAMLKKAFF